MKNDLRRLLDRHSGGALETMNQLCRQQGLEGYITATTEGKDGLFTFSAYKNGDNCFFALTRIPGGAYIVGDVQASEAIRLLRKQQSRTKLSQGKPRQVWSLVPPLPPDLQRPLQQRHLCRGQARLAYHGLPRIDFRLG